MKHPFVPLVSLLLCFANFDVRPHLEGSPWHVWASAWHLGRTLHLVPALMCLFLAGLGLERRLGAGIFLAAWCAPHLVLLPLLGTSWAELSPVSLLAALVVLGRAEGKAQPWKIWAPLALATVCTLPGAGCGWLPIVLSLLAGLAVGGATLKFREAVTTLGCAAGALTLFGWFS